MKNKKYFAIALSISIIASSFSGIISHADMKDNIKYTTSKAPEPNFIELEPELTKGEVNDSNCYIEEAKPINFKNRLNLHIKNKKNNTSKTTNGSSIASNVDNNGTSSTDYEVDIYNFNKKDIENLLEKGYSMQDIYEADEMGNKVIEDPEKILNQKDKEDESIEKISEDIMSDKKEIAINDLKNKYKEEYAKLSEEKLKDDQIVSMLIYMDSNNLKLTDELITEYKEKGDKLYQNIVSEKLSKEYKKKYKISDSDAKYLTDNLIRCYEKISKDSNLSVNQLIKDYVKQNKN